MTLALALVLATGAAAPAPAPAPEPIPEAAQALPWDKLESSVGSWAEFAMLTGGYPTGPFLRIAIVGEEEVDGKAGTWVEIWISQQPGSASQVYKILTVGDPRRPGALKRALFRWAGGAVNELPKEKLAMKEPKARRRDAQCAVAGTCAAEAIDHPPEAVQTPAGTFQARKREVREKGKTVARVWYTDDLPVMGVVRLDLADGRGLELIEVGTGARSAISGPVRVYDPGPPPAAAGKGP